MGEVKQDLMMLQMFILLFFEGEFLMGHQMKN